MGGEHSLPKHGADTISTRGDYAGIEVHGHDCLEIGPSWHKWYIMNDGFDGLSAQWQAEVKRRCRRFGVYLTRLGACGHLCMGARMK